MTIIMPSGSRKNNWFGNKITKTASTENGAEEVEEKDELLEAATKFLQTTAEYDNKQEGEGEEGEKDKVVASEETKEATEACGTMAENEGSEDTVTSGADCITQDSNEGEDEECKDAECVEEVVEKAHDKIHDAEEALNDAEIALSDVEDALEGDEVSEVDEVSVDVEDGDEEVEEVSEISFEVNEDTDEVVEETEECAEGDEVCEDEDEEEIVVHSEDETVTAASNDGFQKFAHISPETRKKTQEYWTKYMGYPKEYVDLLVKNY